MFDYIERFYASLQAQSIHRVLYSTPLMRQPPFPTSFDAVTITR